MQAAERDKGKKGKLAKKRKKGKKKASKKGKKKKDKDLTPDRTLESLFEEMVVNGIIRMTPNVPLDTFVGGMNNVASTIKKQARKDPVPGPGDIRRVVAEYCILPMSKRTVTQPPAHQLASYISKDKGNKSYIKLAIAAVATTSKETGIS